MKVYAVKKYGAYDSYIDSIFLEKEKAEWYAKVIRGEVCIMETADDTIEDYVDKRLCFYGKLEWEKPYKPFYNDKVYFTWQCDYMRNQFNNRVEVWDLDWEVHIDFYKHITYKEFVSKQETANDFEVIMYMMKNDVEIWKNGRKRIYDTHEIEKLQNYLLDKYGKEE